MRELQSILGGRLYVIRKDVNTIPGAKASLLMYLSEKEILCYRISSTPVDFVDEDGYSTPAYEISVDCGYVPQDALTVDAISLWLRDAGYAVVVVKTALS
jgi:hypothetical protein